jgi:hypothetical protein
LVDSGGTIHNLHPIILHESHAELLYRVFWHQLNAHKITSLTNFLLFDVFKLPEKHLATMYLCLATNFLLSGIMHLLVDISEGISPLKSGAIMLFCTQILGILIEGFVAKMYWQLFVPSEREANIFEMVAGYSWVVLFLTWSTPIYLYPMLYRSNLGIEDSWVPFSVLKTVGEKMRW